MYRLVEIETGHWIKLSKIFFHLTNNKKNKLSILLYRSAIILLLFLLSKPYNNNSQQLFQINKLNYSCTSFFVYLIFSFIILLKIISITLATWITWIWSTRNTIPIPVTQKSNLPFVRTTNWFECIFKSINNFCPIFVNGFTKLFQI